MAHRIPEGVVAKRVGDEIVIVHLDQGFYYGLDPVGARIWELIESGTAVEEIVETLQAEYDAERERIAADVARLVADLEAHGLLHHN